MRRTPTVQSRVVIKHRKGCHALAAARRGSWHSPWALPDEPKALAWATPKGNMNASNGRTSRLFVVFKCNDIECEARVLISVDAITALAEDGDEDRKLRRREVSDG